MKRKIIIGLAVYSVVFLSAGAYIAVTIHSATVGLGRLIELHQVEILREHYLSQIKGVQADLALADMNGSGPRDTVVAKIANMGFLIDTCFRCHHSSQGTERLKGLRRQTQKYIFALGRVSDSGLSLPASTAERESAMAIGVELIQEVREMIDETAQGLEKTTRKAMVEIAHTRYLLYGLLVLAPLVSALLGFVFISDLTRPVNVLLESTRKLQGGDLDHRVTGLRDEFGDLAASFNDMAASLKEQMQKTQRAEQMAVFGELAAGLAHEIKNPLAGIKAAMQVLYEEAELSEEDRGVARRVTQEVGRLETLMKNFLNFAKPAKPRLTEMNVNRLIEAVLAFYGRSDTIHPDRKDEIRITKVLGLVPETMADPMQMQQILLNIVLNAVDSMPDGGTLDIRTSFDKRDGLIRIEVSDTGRGVSKEHANKIFHPFFTTKPKGTGLGLAISRQLIEQHGGSVTVTPNSPRGSVFRIHLPLKAPPAVETT